MSRAGAVYKPRRASRVCVCVWCRRPFQATRYDAKTCSAKCRKAWSRFTSEKDESVTVTRRAGEIKLNFKGRSEVAQVERLFYEVKN